MTKRSRSLFDGLDPNILFCDEDLFHNKENASCFNGKLTEHGYRGSGSLVIDTSNTFKKNRFNSNTPISPIEPLPTPSPPPKLPTRALVFDNPTSNQPLQPEPLTALKLIHKQRSTPTPATPDCKVNSFQHYRQTLSPNTPDTARATGTTPHRVTLRRNNSRTCKTLNFDENGNMDTSTCSTSSTSSGSISGESYICSSISPPTPMTPPSPKFQFLSPLSPLSPLHTTNRRGSPITSPTQNPSPSPMSKRALKGFVPCMSPYERSLRIQSLRLSHSLQIDDSVRLPPPIQTQNLSKAKTANSIGSGGVSPTILSMSPVDLGEMSPGVFCDPTPFDTPGSDAFSLILPTIQAPKNPDCNSITPETMLRVLNGEFDERADIIIIDCRFPFEYEGGHIRGATNIFEPETLEQVVFDEKRVEGLRDRETMIIFHCEYSQHRAPKLYRHLRELDRKYHHDTYPDLYYTNIYLVEGGYRGFYMHSNDCKNCCEPQAYIEMNDKSFAQKCKQSWSEMRRSWSKKKRSSKQMSMSYLARQR